LWIISTCELRDQCLNCTQQQFKFKICIQLWVYSLSDPFKLQTTSLLLLLSLIQNPQCTTNQQCNILSGSTLMVPAEASQSLVACICVVMTVAVSSLSSHGHCNPRVLVLSAIKDCGVVVFLINRVIVAVVCVTHTFWWFEPVRAFALWIPVEMYRGPTSTTSL
jgi:hypothetical protein